MKSTSRSKTVGIAPQPAVAEQTGTQTEPPAGQAQGSPDLCGETFRQWVKDFYRDDKLIEGEIERWSLGYRA